MHLYVANRSDARLDVQDFAQAAGSPAGKLTVLHVFSVNMQTLGTRTLNPWLRSKPLAKPKTRTHWNGWALKETWVDTFQDDVPSRVVIVPNLLQPNS